MWAKPLLCRFDIGDKSLLVEFDFNITLYNIEGRYIIIQNDTPAPLCLKF